MAKVLGNLRPEDDYMHPLGPESNFNESAYFNFFDPVHSVGGFLRLGTRANEHQAEMTIALYVGDLITQRAWRPSCRRRRSFSYCPWSIPPRAHCSPSLAAG